ncbi:uncharacterized protein B0H18DRAFT_954952 [Fomitopsis serialis]|uniref:uncharacterized protein n=1 Tax=Fomitopsis serialis TaxID=139415 RepID=UPI002008C18C|nr:uncharacterized protein B0H18DRAFT_954952 [Neoantrodia serialis]KAH9925737.1 hypothetical protein B0H18DRAFT_954952 [Neoantrodia serialis]
MSRQTVSRFTTMNEVQMAMNDILNDPHGPDGIASRLSPSELSFFNATPTSTFRRLLVLRESYHLNHLDTVDRTYTLQSQHNQATRPNEPSSPRLYGFDKAYKEITDSTPGWQTHHFLDLDYTPRGVSSWLLRTNEDAHGVGITLRPGASGTPSQADPWFRERFHECTEDISRIADGRASIGHIPSRGFDLVLANASMALPEDVAPWDDYVHLVYAQLVVALQHIAVDGTLIISLPTRPLVWVLDIIAVLRQSFEGPGSITAVNLEPVDQTRRSIAYVVCRHYGASEGSRRLHKAIIDQNRTSKSVHAFLRIACPTNVDPVVKAGTANAGGTCPRLSSDSDEGILSSQQPFVLELFARIWERQHNAIYGHYQEILRQAYGGQFLVVESKVAVTLRLRITVHTDKTSLKTMIRKCRAYRISPTAPQSEGAGGVSTGLFGPSRPVLKSTQPDGWWDRSARGTQHQSTLQEDSAACIALNEVAGLLSHAVQVSEKPTVL